jgi:hypothetical protein
MSLGDITTGSMRSAFAQSLLKMFFAQSLPDPLDELAGLKAIAHAPAAASRRPDHRLRQAVVHDGIPLGIHAVKVDAGAKR